MTTSQEADNTGLLTYLHKDAQHEIDFLRERQNAIFTWSSNIFLLIIGALLIIDSTKTLAWTGQGMLGKLIASAAVLVLTVFVLMWQQRLRHWQEESTEVRDTIEILLHCYESGYYGTEENQPLYPETWIAHRNYHKRISFWRRVARINFVSASLLLGILAIAMIWLSSY